MSWSLITIVLVPLTPWGVVSLADRTSSSDCSMVPVMLIPRMCIVSVLPYPSSSGNPYRITGVLVFRVGIVSSALSESSINEPIGIG